MKYKIVIIIIRLAMSMTEKRIDPRNLIYLLATSKYPIKLRTLDTLYVEGGNKLKVIDWVYTTSSGYLTLKHNRRVMRHSDTLKAFFFEALNFPISPPLIDLDV